MMDIQDLTQTARPLRLRAHNGYYEKPTGVRTRIGFRRQNVWFENDEALFAYECADSFAERERLWFAVDPHISSWGLHNAATAHDLVMSTTPTTFAYRGLWIAA